jgi:hypothetical protein
VRQVIDVLDPVRVRTDGEVWVHAKPQTRYTPYTPQTSEVCDLDGTGARERERYHHTVTDLACLVRHGDPQL